MLVNNRMTKEPDTVEPNDLAIRAQHKMLSGGYHRVPVVSDGKLVGIVSDRDLRAHHGHLEQVKINGIMTEQPITVTPEATVEEAAQIMLERQIGGLPVIADGRLVGIITVNDVLRAFLDVMGATRSGSTRIDFVLEGEERGFNEATRIVAREGGDVLGVGTYRETLGANPVCYLRLFAGSPERIAKALRSAGFNVLGVHKTGG